MTTDEIVQLDSQFRMACSEFADAVVLASVGSSNQYLFDRPVSQNIRPQAVWALEQTQGRGRRGRTWVGDPANSLMLSVLFGRQLQTAQGATAPPLSGLPIAVGVGVVRALEQWVPGLRIKWPNDLQRDGKKCAGILIESRQRILHPAPTPIRVDQVVIGIGLNLYLDEHAQQRIGQPACGLFDSTPDVARATMAARIARELTLVWERFQRSGLDDVLSEWPAFDALADQPVVVLDGERVLYEGIACGIAASGALRLRKSDERVVEIHAGEVSVRRRPLG